jgi:hypothetical protein
MSVFIFAVLNDFLRFYFIFFNLKSVYYVSVHVVSNGKMAKNSYFALNAYIMLFAFLLVADYIIVESVLISVPVICFFSVFISQTVGMI